MILASAAAFTIYSATPVILGLGAAVAYAAPSAAGAHLSLKTIRSLLWLAWGLHGLAVLWSLLGLSPHDVPRFGFAPALSVTAWLVLTVYAIESHMYPKLQAVWAFAGLGAAAVLLALVFPGQALHSAASPWLPLHWALGLASYGMFAAAVVHAWLMMRAETQMRLTPSAHTLSTNTQSGLPLLTLERLTFRFVMAGFVLLTATLLAGWLFSETLYGIGKAWKWEHKTIFSVLAWVAFAVLLVGRAQFGWRGRAAVRVLYIGSGLLLLAYVGSRFVLEVILGRSL